MKKSSAQLLQDLFKLAHPIPAKGALSIVESAVSLAVLFPTFECPVENTKKWRLRSHEQSVIHHETELSVMSVQKNHPVAQPLRHPAVSFEHLFVGLLQHF